MAEVEHAGDYPYAKQTGKITVRVRPVFLEERSSSVEDRYIWAYHVRIENDGGDAVQLMRRHWRIVSSIGKVIEVEGEGVIGEQPVLEPGTVFEYTSGTPLPTPSGIMSGTYSMVDHDGQSFEIEIPAFSLDSPWSPRTLN